MVLSPVICRLHRFECQGVDNSCQNLNYIPAKPHAAQTHAVMIYTTFLHLNYQQLVAVVVAHLVYGCKDPCRFHAHISSFLCQTFL